MKKRLLPVCAFIIFFTTFICTRLSAQNISPYWSLAGNNNASTAAKLGTTNAIPLRLLTKNAERLRIDTLGRVGIGTLNPQQRLQVEGSANQAIFISTTSLGSSSGSGMIGYAKALPTAAGQRLGYFTLGSRSNGEKAYHAAGMSGYSSGAWTAGSSYPAYLTFETTPAGSPNRLERLRIDPNGNVGIGTIAPAYKLHVEAGSAKAAVYGNSSYGNNGLYGYASGGLGYGNGVYGNSTYTGVRGTGGAYGVYADATGSGGTGVSGIGYTGVYGYGNAYGVYGSATTDYNTRSYAGYFNGTVYSTGIYQGSDSTLKQNLEDMTNARAILGKLQPKSYEFRQDGHFKLMNLPAGKHYGLIAQEVEKVLPNLVKNTRFETKMAKTASKSGSEPLTGTQPSEVIEFKAVNYTELIPIIIKGMQEQEEENKALKEQLDDQQQQIKELRQIILELKGSTDAEAISGAYLEQNTPNPVKSSTRIAYNLPQSTRKAQLLIADASGKSLKVFSLEGSGFVNVNASGWRNGTYTYSLVVNGKTVQTRKLTIVN